MNDVISRAQILKFLNRMEESAADENLISKIALATIKYVRNFIAAIPSIDAVLVVRCKDCKFYTARNYIEKTGICTLATRHLGDDGYCSEGERKEGNTGEIS